MRGVLLVASSSPTLSPIYDGLEDVSVTSNITWFHLNHDTWFYFESLNYPSTEDIPLQWGQST